LFLAMLVAASAAGPSAGAASEDSDTRDTAAPPLRTALLAALVIALLAFGLVDVRRMPDSAASGARVLDVVLGSLTSVPTTSGTAFSPALLWVFLLTAVVSVVLGEHRSSPERRENIRRGLLSAGIILVVLFGSVAIQTRARIDDDRASWSGSLDGFPGITVVVIGIVALI